MALTRALLRHGTAADAGGAADAWAAAGAANTAAPATMVTAARTARGPGGLRAETDRNGNLWAWWEPPGTEGQPAVVTGSHLDSVPDGGAFDGPLGVVSGFAALDELRKRGVTPARPLAVAAFTEEEGARF